ncbi:LLM class flavin-dependent oxidoreductase [Saccharothrix coeruleofusca]|uniref:FMN-linked alkanal monooxygenase n=1 Tax=Saccharothrix coeruleofusca TaxID=33919 RepID=A0A918EFL3_9PSEU|nr:LLM class flavin-dependent oxidoreductase [Saccharothrix coeruleofusca]MBP2335825.1 luciferase family oxidoreductase group 1 [Saccharothrix coeruleofusca]GGP74957.1 FMN-linked alkanal monooxygenase [Saccharothrix coeruleofusca]
MTRHTPLSVLDLSPVPAGGTAADALRNTVELAHRAEEFGYHRFWVAEHHFVSGVASSAPAVLVGLLAAATSRIRVGSGAVLLGHHQPVVVAEQFGTVAQLHPDRVDLGLGRSGLLRAQDLRRSPVVTEELVARLEEQQRLLGVRPDGGQDYAGEVGTILDLISGEGGRLALPATGADLEVWVLGSSAGPSSLAAGGLGLPFAANFHVSPNTVDESVASYREAFVPSKRLDRPRVLVSAEVVVAEDDATARELAEPYGSWVLSIRSGRGAVPVAGPLEAAAFPWTEAQRGLVRDRLDTQIVGSPRRAAEQLAALRERTGADELLVTTTVHAHADRVRSFELLALAWAELEE